jgi:hypothetical protein
MNGGVMTKVYVVTEGSYSEYHIISVFSTRELADKFAALYDADVEEYELDKHEMQAREGLAVYKVWMSRDGGSSNYRSDEYQPGEYELIVISGGRNERTINLVGSVLATSAEHAVKIVNEKRAQLIASGEWDEFEKMHPPGKSLYEQQIEREMQNMVNWEYIKRVVLFKGDE